MLKMIFRVFRHEAKDLIRDSATLKTMAILLVFMPILYSYIIGDFGNRIQEVFDKEKKLGYIDDPAIHNVLPWLEQQGVNPIPVKDRSKETFEKEKLDAILTVTPRDELDMGDKVKTSYEIWTNGTNEKKQVAARFVQKQLALYGNILARQNLIMAGAAPQLLDTIGAEVKSIEQESKSGVAHALLVALLGMALFFTTLHIAVDATAGERERMTLESLLYTAAPRSAIVLGKYLFVAAVALLGMIWAGVIFWILGEVSIFQEILGRTGGSFTLKQLFLGILIMSPLCTLVAGMQLLIGSLSSSVKQAQAYNSVTSMLSMPLSFLIFLEQIEGLAYTPIFGQGIVYRRVLQGELWDMNPFIIAQLITVGLGLIMLFAVIKRFEGEKIILAKS